MMPIADLYHLFLESEGISIDTRSMKPGMLFFALKGKNFNGDNFAKEAIEKGALAAVVSDQSLNDEKYVYVSDTLVALQDLAHHHRKTFWRGFDFSPGTEPCRACGF